VSKEDLDDLQNVHPAFIQKNAKVQESLKSNKLKVQVKNTNKACNKQSCGCPPPVGPVIQSSSSSTSSSSNPFSSSSSSPCVVEDGNPYSPANQVPSSSSPPSSSSSIPSDGTGACITDGKSTNAVGQIGPKQFAITKPPYKLFSCDQVLILDAQTFINPRDYQKRRPAVFTLSVYMVNQFDSKDSKTMKNHLLLENITNLPDNIFGAPSCVEFIDSKTLNKMNICLNSKQEADDLVEVFMDFLKCRIGDNLKNVSQEDLKKVYEAACLGTQMNIPEDSGIAKLSTFLAPFLPVATKPPTKNFGAINPYYNPDFVPGSKIPHGKDDHTDQMILQNTGLGNRRRR
jgi:hypothetical protein